MPGELLVRHLSLLRRISRKSAAARALAWTLAAGAPAAAALVLHSRLTNPAPGAALARCAVAWTALASIAVAGWAGLRMRRGPADSVLASRLDGRASRDGLFSAAASVLGGGAAPPALAGVVLERADAAVSGVALPARDAVRWRRIQRALLFLVLSLLLALVPGGPQGRLFGIGAGGEGQSSPAPAGTSEDGPGSRPDSRGIHRIPLDEIVQMTLRSDRQKYRLNEEIQLTVELKTLVPVASDVALEVILTVADGLPSPDAGFGEGRRPVPLRLGWTVPKEAGGQLKQRFPIKATLIALGVYRPGLFTCRVFARPDDADAAASDGAGTNELMFQVEESIENLKSSVPQPQGRQQQPEKQTPSDKKDEKNNRQGRSKPKLGDPDRLAGAERVQSLVKPIVNPGPTIEKEVSVFDQERGGPPPPLPVPRKPLEDNSGRTFLRRAEVPIAAPGLSAEERDVLRRYFDSIRAQKKL